MAIKGLQFFPTKVEAAKYLKIIKTLVKFNKEVRFSSTRKIPVEYETQKYKGYYIFIEDISLKSMADLKNVISGIKGLTMIARHFTVTYAIDTAEDKKYYTKLSKGKEYNAFIYKYK